MIKTSAAAAVHGMPLPLKAAALWAVASVAAAGLVPNEFDQPTRMLLFFGWLTMMAWVVAEPFWRAFRER